MTTYSIKAPDGNTYQIDGPAGASQADVQAEVMRQHPALQQSSQTPDNGGILRNIGAGAESAITGIPSALASLLPGATTISEVGQAMGQKIAHPNQPVTSVVDPSQMSSAINAGLGKITPALNPDTVTANSFPERLARGVGAGLTAGLIPGEEGYGLVSALTNAGLGGLSGATGQAGAEIANTTGHQNLAPLATIAGSAAPLGAASLVNALRTRGPLTANEEQAMNAGYKLPPATMGNPSVLSKVLGGWSGKIKSQQAASASNQETTNSLAAKDLGLPDDTVLVDSAFDRVRGPKGAGKAYDAVRTALPTQLVDEQFKADAAKFGQLNSDLAEDFPELVKNQDITDLSTSFANKNKFSTSAGIKAVRVLRANATKNIQAVGDPQANALGFAQRQAADSIDDLIERNLDRMGQSEGLQGDVGYLADDYRAARQLIAKSYDVQAATNPATGDVSAAKLGQMAQNGRPLTGNLKTIAETALAFPKAVQSPSKFGGVEPISVLDLMSALGAAGASVMAGRPLEGAAVAGAILSRPGARALIMSDPYQASIANPGATNSAAFISPNVAPLVGALNQYQGGR